MRRDENKYPWGWFSDSDQKPEKLFYAISDSWLDTHLFHQVFYNDYPDYFLINRASRGMGNSQMIDTLRNEIGIIKSMGIDVTFLVVLTEVGRRNKDFERASPVNFKKTHDYFGEILKNQHNEIRQILEGHKHHITTGFISNNFNSNKSIVDFCGETQLNKPDGVFTVVSNGVWEFLKDRGNIFNFDFAADVEKSLRLKHYLESLECMDHTLHPDRYKVYEDFLENVFSDLKRNNNML
jgi:hypothetical protein